jgi:hypothetical protein
VRGRDAIWLALALGFHALALLLPLLGATPPVHEQVTTVTEIALDDLPREPAPDYSVGTATSTASVEAKAARRALGAARIEPAGPPETETAPSADGVGDAPMPTLEPGPPAGLAGLSNDSLGIGGRNVLLGRMFDGGVGGGGELAEGRPLGNVAPGIQASLTDALHTRDVELGLAAGGVLVAPAEEVARASETPWNSNATFEIATDGAGEVTSVRLVEVSEAWGAWERVAADILGAVRARKIKVHATGRGLVVTLQVASRNALPSGAGARYEAHTGDTTELKRIVRDIVPPKPGGSTTSAEAPPPGATAPRVDVLKPNPKVEDANPKNDTAINVRLPEQRANTVNLVGGTFDLSDIGARPQRSVHARVVREKAL